MPTAECSKSLPAVLVTVAALRVQAKTGAGSLRGSIFLGDAHYCPE
jgi:hypothetical protein